MLNNGNKQTCGFADEIVSYIYDESDEAERRSFETHLVGCIVCTDEFAAISNARLSVFEWQKEEFAPLSTPEIVIPYAPKPGVEHNVSIGFLSGLKEFFSLTIRPVAITAALAVCVGLGFVAMTYIGRGDEPIAVNKNEAVPPVAPDNTGPGPQLIQPVEPVPEIAATTGVARREKAADRSVTGSRKKTASQVRKPVNDVAQRNPNQRPAPVLNSYDDLDDKSLRLADLFDEVGGGI